MRIIITGASGFIGQQIVPILKERGAEMLLIGRDPAGLAEHFAGEQTANYNEITEKGRGYDALVHLAVLNNDQPGSEADFHTANVILLTTVIEACRAAGVRRLIYTSSLQAGAADTPYARSKAAADDILKEVNDLTLIKLHLPAVYGERAYKGNLAVLNKMPPFARPVAFQTLASLKPTAHVGQIATAIIEHSNSNASASEILSDRQQGNYIYHITKKLIDIGFALAVTVSLWWLLIGVWLAVRFTSVGPGILTQTRVGRFGESFTLYKFRTMQQGTKQAGTHEVSADSVTKVGHFLRRTKIDELPQIINILKGEISLVGPRPCLPVQTELTEARSKRGVLEVLPGITGYAQVRGVDMSDNVHLTEIDVRYCALRTIPLDLQTIVQTAIGRGHGDQIKKDSITEDNQPTKL